MTREHDERDAHLSAPTSQPTLPIEIHGKLYDVPIPVQVHIVSLGVQIKQADERGDEALRRAHELERLAETSQPDRKALADAKKLVNDFARACVYGSDDERIKRGRALEDRLAAAHPVQEPAGDVSAVSLLALKQWLIEKGWWNKLPMSWFSALDAAIGTPAAPAVPSEELAEAKADSERRHQLLILQHAESVELWNALKDLSFECDGVTRTVAPSRETYNKAFAVLQRKLHLSPEAMCGHASSGLAQQSADAHRHHQGSLRAGDCEGRGVLRR